jgi:hypothetical protein
MFGSLQRLNRTEQGTGAHRFNAGLPDLQIRRPLSVGSFSVLIMIASVWPARRCSSDTKAKPFISGMSNKVGRKPHRAILFDKSW